MIFVGVPSDPKAAAKNMLSEPVPGSPPRDLALHAAFVAQIRLLSLDSCAGADPHLYLEEKMREAFAIAEAEAARARSVGEETDTERCSLFLGPELVIIPNKPADAAEKLYGIVSYVAMLVGARDVEHAVRETIRFLDDVRCPADVARECVIEAEDLRKKYTEAVGSRNGVFRGDGFIAIAPPHDGLYPAEHSVVIGFPGFDCQLAL